MAAVEVPDLPDLIRILQLTGHYYTFSGRWAYVYERLQVLRVVVALSLCLASVAALFVGGLRSSLGVEMCYSCLGLMTACQLLYLFFKRRETEATIRMIQEIRDTFQKGSEEEFKNNTRTIWKVVKVLTFVVFGSCAPMSIPFFVDLVIWAVWKTPRAFRIPIAMDSFIDEEPIRDLKYFVVMISASVWSMMGCTAQVGIDSFLFVSCISYSSMVMTFCKSLRQHFSNFTPTETTAHLRRLAAHQGALYTLSRRMKELFGLTFFIQNLFGAICICSLVFVISADDSINPLLMIAYFANLVAVISVLGTTAYVGQHVLNKTSEIFTVLYEMNWYELRPIDRRYLVIMLSAAREPFRIHFYGLLPLDMENFMGILNKSYSYFMFLKSTE